jgi:hypothetical protein
VSPAASQTTYLVKLQDRRQVAERTIAFQFEKPDGFTFMTGQSIDLTLMHPPETDGEGNGRTFSITSAPDEDLLLVATWMRETAFKRVLGTLPIGSPSQDRGTVRQPGPSSRSSQDRSVSGRRNRHHTVPQYPAASGQRAIASPSVPLLCESPARRCPVFTGTGGVETTQPQIYIRRHHNGYWSIASCLAGGDGGINHQMLAKYVPSVASPIYYLAGPPGMVGAMRTVLHGMRVDDGDIRTEEFAGY